MKRLKRLTKIKIKYFLIILFFLILCATIIPTFMRYYISITANINGHAKETRKSTYNVNFYNNGGSREMESMTIKYNQKTKLTKNTFTYEEYNFGG